MLDKLSVFYLPYVALVVLIATIYFLLGEVGQLLAMTAVNVSPVWPAAGYALAMMMIYGKKALLGIFIGASVFNLIAFIAISPPETLTTSVLLSLIIGLGTCLQSWVGYRMLNRISTTKTLFESVSFCSIFVIIVPIMCLMSSSVGVMSLWITGILVNEAVSEVWFTWWLGDSAGVMIAMPLIMAWRAYKSLDWDWSSVGYLSIIMAFLLGSAVVSFGPNVTSLKFSLPFVFLTWPFLIRLSLKHSIQSVSCGVVLVSFIAVYFTAEGYGPFIADNINQSLLLLQLYIFVTSGTIYITTALAQEKSQSLARLKETKQNLEKLNGELEARVSIRTKELEKAKEVAENNARTDFLTGLNNRRAFSEYAANMRAQSKRFKKPYSIAMLDIDNFKAINDKWGHKAGDKSIQMIANSLNVLLREMDIKGRVGGEEFAIIFPLTRVDDVYQLSERIRQHIASQMIEVDAGVFGLTVSIGVAGSEEGTEEFEEIMLRADKALYEAKNGKKNNVKIYL